VREPRVVDRHDCRHEDPFAINAEQTRRIEMVRAGQPVLRRMIPPLEYVARMSGDHIRVNRDSWDEDAPNWVESNQPCWGAG
jgi:hypothetical protein